MFSVILNGIQIDPAGGMYQGPFTVDFLHYAPCGDGIDVLRRNFSLFFVGFQHQKQNFVADADGLIGLTVQIFQLKIAGDIGERKFIVGKDRNQMISPRIKMERTGL